MTIHLLKLSVGAETIQDLQDWVDRRTNSNKANGLGDLHDHVTRMFPKKRAELLDGGSIYWVIKGNILVRQEIVDLVPVVGPDNIERCAIMLNPPLIPTQAFPRKAFQGWRYLSVEDAPDDLSVHPAKGTSGRKRRAETTDAVSQAELRAELASLGLL